MDRLDELEAIAILANEMTGADPEDVEGMCMGCGKNGPLRNGHHADCLWVRLREALDRLGVHAATA